MISEFNLANYLETAFGVAPVNYLYLENILQEC